MGGSSATSNTNVNNIVRQNVTDVRTTNESHVQDYDIKSNISNINKGDTIAESQRLFSNSANEGTVIVDMGGL